MSDREIIGRSARLVQPLLKGGHSDVDDVDALAIPSALGTVTHHGATDGSIS